MAENSKIQWCDHTFNPWEGCTKISPGCTHCYAEARNNRFVSREDRAKGIGGNWGKGKPRRRTSVANWKLPLKWNREAEGIDGRNALRSAIGMEESNPHRPRVFCASLADWLDDEVPTEWLADLLKLIHDTPNLDWLLLTKRPENWRGRIQETLTMWEDAPEYAEEMSAFLDSWLDCIDMPERGDVPQNIWIGASAEDQPRADERRPELMKIPAKVRFLSVEPMLGPIDFRLKGETSHQKFPEDFEKWSSEQKYKWLGGRSNGIHWAIFGGESGPGARPCNIEWIRDGVRQCRSAGIKVFVKQLGSVPMIDFYNQDDEVNQWIDNTQHIIWNGPGRKYRWHPWDGQPMSGSEYELQLKDKKGGDITEWPEDLRDVRDFPV